MITWVRSFQNTPCKSLWRLRNPTVPVQQHFIKNFCEDNSINDCLTTCTVPTDAHDIVSLVLNDCNFVSVQQIDSLLTGCLSKTKKFLHLAVNKFLVYTEYDQNLYADQLDLDLRLVLYWSNCINRNPVVAQYCDNDCGQLGNFIYPVTQVIWPAND